ncbi:hypothetical protein VTJ83DRAFT_1532 [Remersonia thermophila]|uniref:Uncharacterized protein n=1 Tax=Remersonia thermophila TaxID=72144 RepID=A0ABR4DG63_9PEZI
MALPASLIPVFRTKRFWTDYYWFTEVASPCPYRRPFRDAAKALLDPEEDEPSGPGPGDQDGGDDDDDGGGGVWHKIELEIPISWTPVPELERASGDRQDGDDQGGEPDEDDRKSRDSKPSLPAPAYHLSLKMHTQLYDITLGYSTPRIAREKGAGNPCLLGWDDQAHWHPYALRWAELELLSRAVAAAAAAAAAGTAAGTATERARRRWETVPGLVVLLLCRFAPICGNTLHDDGDDPDAEACKIVRMIARAFWQVLGRDGVDDETVRRFVERADFRRPGFRWFREEGPGSRWWIGCGDDPGAAGDVYTLRSRESVGPGGSWDGEEWDRLLQAARRVVEQHGAAAGAGPDPTASVADEELLARFGPRKWHGYRVHLPFTKRDRPLRQRAGRYFALVLGGILRVLNFGGVSLSATGRGRLQGDDDVSDVWLWAAFSVSLCCDPSPGRALLLETLRWLRAPLACRISPGGDAGEPFTLADVQDETVAAAAAAAAGGSYLGIFVPVADPGSGSSVDHTLPDSLKDVLASPDVLGDGGQVSGPTDNGWYAVTAAGDGGELGLNLSRAEEEELKGTGAVALRKVTPQVTAILHRFMAAADAVLAPVALAARPLPQAVQDAPEWLEHRVVDCDELHAMLSGGAYKVWLEADKREAEEKESGDPALDLKIEEYKSNTGW